MTYYGNGSVTRWLNATITPWQITPEGPPNRCRLLGGAQIKAALDIDGIHSYRTDGLDLLFKMKAESLRDAMDAADYGAEVQEEE